MSIFYLSACQSSNYCTKPHHVIRQARVNFGSLILTGGGRESLPTQLVDSFIFLFCQMQMVSCVRFVLFLCTRDTANSWVLSARRLISILSVRRSRQSWRFLEEQNFFVLYFLICKISGLSVCSIRIPNFISLYFLLTLSLE